MSNESSTISWKRDEAISIPSSSQERRIAIRYLDWDRCKKSLKKCNQPIPRFHLVFSFLFGIAATSGFSLITFLLNPLTNLPAWGYPLYSLVCIFSLFTGICFVYVDRKVRSERRSDIASVIEDMDAIEKTFG